MEIMLIVLVSALNIVCFFVGAKVGQTVSKGEDIELPTINPMELYKQHRDIKAAEEEKNRLNIIMENIERYDGTGNGQKDVPR